MPRTSGHGFEVRVGKFKGNVLGKLFLHRVYMVAWNMLPDVVVEAVTIEVFKRLLDVYRGMHGMERYGSHAGRGHWFNLALCSTQTLWTKRPVPVSFHSS